MSRQPYVEAIDSARDMSGIGTPVDGWLKVARKALGMSPKTLARRLGLSTREIAQLERREKCGVITIDELTQAAKGLGYRLEYTLVASTTDFNGWPVSAEDLVRRQAQRVARRLMHSIDAERAARGETSSASDRERQIQNIAAALIHEMPNDFWDDADNFAEASEREHVLSIDADLFRSLVRVLQEAKVGRSTIAKLLGLTPARYRDLLRQVQDGGVLDEPLSKPLIERMDLIQHEVQTATLLWLVNARGHRVKGKLKTPEMPDHIPVSRAAVSELLNQMGKLQHAMLEGHPDGG